MRSVEEYLADVKVCAEFIIKMNRGSPTAGLANDIIDYINDALEQYRKERPVPVSIPGVV